MTTVKQQQQNAIRQWKRRRAQNREMRGEEIR